MLQEVTANSQRKKMSQQAATLITAPLFLISILGSCKLRHLRVLTAFPETPTATFSTCVPLVFLYSRLLINTILLCVSENYVKTLCYSNSTIFHFSPSSRTYFLCMYHYHHINKSLRGRESKRMAWFITLQNCFLKPLTLCMHILWPLCSARTLMKHFNFNNQMSMLSPIK